MKVKKIIGGHNPPWMLALGGQPSWIVTTRVTASLNINILGNTPWEDL